MDVDAKGVAAAAATTPVCGLSSYCYSATATTKDVVDSSETTDATMTTDAAVSGSSCLSSAAAAADSNPCFSSLSTNSFFRPPPFTVGDFCC